jgi:hypothetical protein
MEFIEYLTPTHLEILQILNQSRVEVIENFSPSCDSKKYDGEVITYRDKRNPHKTTVLAICTDTVKTNYSDWVNELNVTFAHESLHVAQACRSNDGYIRVLGFRKDVEQEAFAVQHNPREVLRILKKYCL